MQFDLCRGRSRPLFSVAIVLGLNLCVLAGAARATPGLESPAGRVSDLRGDLSVRGVWERDVSYADLNTTISKGDIFWTGDGDVAELELGSASWVRLSGNTKLELLRMPGVGGKLRLWQGSAYVHASTHLAEPLLVPTPAGRVDVQPGSVVRVDVEDETSTRVSVFAGEALVRTDREDSLRVSAGERVVRQAKGGVVPAHVLDGQADGFDRYDRERDAAVSRPAPAALKHAEDLVGSWCLAEYGTWVEDHGATFWQPHVEPEWRPYSDGYWSYGSDAAFVWVDYRPWGYVTSHYGRWSYLPAYGWLWSPGSVWGAAYVSWCDCDGYYGWAPLDPLNRPVFFGLEVFTLEIDTRSVVVDRRSWTFVRRDTLPYSRHHRRLAQAGRDRTAFMTAAAVHMGPGNTRMVSDPYREIGVPKDPVRGVVRLPDGQSARDRVLSTEGKMPERQRKLIEHRFRLSASRDAELAQQRGAADELQHHLDRKLRASDLVRGAGAVLAAGATGRPGPAGLPSYDTKRRKGDFEAGNKHSGQSDQSDQTRADNGPKPRRKQRGHGDTDEKPSGVSRNIGSTDPGLPGYAPPERDLGRPGRGDGRKGLGPREERGIAPSPGAPSVPASPPNPKTPFPEPRPAPSRGPRPKPQPAPQPPPAPLPYPSRPYPVQPYPSPQPYPPPSTPRPTPLPPGRGGTRNRPPVGYPPNLLQR